MKKLIVLSVIVAGMVSMGAFSTLVHAQAPANDLKPTFISPTPGLYVNGWPAFTVSYPKEWVEQPPARPGVVFSAGVSRSDLRSNSFYIAATSFPYPLEDWAKLLMPYWVQLFTDVKILSDKPSLLKDGTPAREAEVACVDKDGRTSNVFLLLTMESATIVFIRLNSDKGPIGEDLKKIAYSLTFQPDREEPVQVPPDVRAFLDMYCVDIVRHDVKAIMEHLSDRFLQSGANKAWQEQYYRNDPASPVQRGVISFEATVTVFEPHGDKAYIDGFFVSKAKGDANAWKTPMAYRQIINEHGEWKWLGSQK